MLGEKMDGDWETAMVMAVLVGRCVQLMVENDFCGRKGPKRWTSSTGSWVSDETNTNAVDAEGGAIVVEARA